LSVGYGRRLILRLVVVVVVGFFEIAHRLIADEIGEEQEGRRRMYALLAGHRKERDGTVAAVAGRWHANPFVSRTTPTMRDRQNV